MTPYRARGLDLTLPVRVYRCLHGRDGSFSIAQGGLVVAHADTVHLLGVKTVVSAAGCKRICETARKRVVAFLDGMIGDWPDGAIVDGEWRFSAMDAAFVGVRDDRLMRDRRLIFADAATVWRGGMITTGSVVSVLAR